MCTARAMADSYEVHAKLTKYVHACAHGHESIQIAAGSRLGPQDYLYAYYRDDAILLSLGMTPEELMLQLFAKKTDLSAADEPITVIRHQRDGFPHPPQQLGHRHAGHSATGAAMGLQYREDHGLGQEVEGDHPLLVLCSIGDAAMTEGEVSEALHMATLR